MPRGVPKDKARLSQLMPRCGGRNEIDRAKDGWYAAQQVARGRTYTEIAEELNEKNPSYSLSASTVRSDIEQMLIDWKRENLDRIDTYISKELFHLEDLERQAQESFEASKGLKAQDYPGFIKLGYTMEDVDAIFAEKKRSGDPAYLQLLLNIQERKLKLLGIDKGNDVSQNTVINYNFGGLDDDSLMKMADVLQDEKAEEILREMKTDEQ